MKSKRYLAIILVLTLAGAIAVEAATISVTITITAAQATRIQSVITRINQNTCKRLGLSPTCDDATAKGQDPTATIYADTNAFATAQLTQLANSLDAQADTISFEDAASAWKANQAIVATNGQCTTAGLSNGCTRGQIACKALTTTNVTCSLP